MADPGPGQTGPGDRTAPSEERRALERLRLEAAVERARRERDLAQWRNRRLRDRRAWRIFEVVVAAVRSPRRWLTLPAAILRIVIDRREAPPPPEPLELLGRSAPPSPVPAVRRARSALERGQHSRALAAAEEALEIDPSDVRALQVAWRAHDALGAITTALKVVRQQRAIQDRTWLRAAERRLQGELIALDPQWLPSVVRVEGTAGGPVLLIDDGREAGPEVAHLVKVPAHHDLAEFYAIDDLPLDSATQDLAWWAARSARQHRPRAVAARLTTDLRPAIAACAIARAGGLPFWLVDADAGPDTVPADSERGRRCRDRASHLRAAAVVVTDAAPDAVADAGPR